MSVKTTTVYNCDYCQKQLPDDYATTNGEGKVKAKKYITVKKRDPKPVSKPSTSKNKKKTAIKKGDKVQFKGGPVYISSDASRPTVTRGKAKCNCTIVNSNKHPYHLIHYSGAMVYGWVNASDCEKI